MAMTRRLRRAARAPIPVQTLDLAPRALRYRGVAVQSVLRGEIAEVATHLVSIQGSGRHAEPASSQHEVVWLVLAGRGRWRTRDAVHNLEAESIARAPLGWPGELSAAAGQTLHALRIRRRLRAQDREQLAKFPEHNQASFVRRFGDCPSYGEAIKSARTVSRTLLAENYVPRMAAGTVEAAGPDAVAAHRHPMLEQLFLGLAGNQATVTADEAEVALPAFALLHIPLGSNHGARVEAGKHLHYVWLDFFLNVEGQDWLKMHRPLEPAAAKRRS